MIQEFDAIPHYCDDGAGSYTTTWIVRVALDLSQAHAIRRVADPADFTRDHAVIHVRGDEFVIRADDYDRLLKDWRAARAKP